MMKMKMNQPNGLSFDFANVILSLSRRISRLEIIEKSFMGFSNLKFV